MAQHAGSVAGTDDWTDIDSMHSDNGESLTAERIRALEAELAAARKELGSDDDDDEASDAAEMARLQREAARLQQQDAAGTDSASSAASQRAQLTAVVERNAELQRALAEGDIAAMASLSLGSGGSTGGDASAPSAAAQAALAASAARRQSMGVQLSAHSGSIQQAAADLTARRKGVDLCFLVDCTGSMAKHIEEMLAQVDAIFSAATQLHSDAIVRVAMIGYRDVCNPQRFEVFDFVEASGAEDFRSFLAGVRAHGGECGGVQHCMCEDVLGGLQEVTQLAWRSSTKLLIHIADYPCHGQKYQVLGPPLNGWDLQCYLPAGNTSGEDPEEYVRWLASRRIDYFFGEITEYTRCMTRIFEHEYSSAQAQFAIRSARDPAADFVPLVLSSMSSSIGRSPHLSSGALSPAAGGGAASGAEVPSFLTPLLR